MQVYVKAFAGRQKSFFRMGSLLHLASQKASGFLIAVFTL